MPTTSQIAAELRRVADSLDKEPAAETVYAMLTFYCDTKDEFLTCARLLPRPLNKVPDFNKYVLETPEKYNAPVYVRALIDRQKVCKLIKPATPAEYECSALLSEQEEEGLLA